MHHIHWQAKKKFCTAPRPQLKFRLAPLYRYIDIFPYPGMICNLFYANLLLTTIALPLALFFLPKKSPI